MPYFVKGKDIELVGTLEALQGVAAVSQKMSPSGEITYDGGTEIWWDNQKTATNSNGERLWVDEDGNAWAESEIEWRED